MSVSLLRYLLCCAMIVVVPRTMLGQDLPTGQPAGAILHTQGGVLVNGAEARDSSALFPGDVVETKTGFSANLSIEGSTVVIGPESVTKFQSDYLELDHGSVSVGTSRSFQVHVNCVKVVPVLKEWTQYETTYVSSRVDVAAKKDDVNVEHEMARKKSGPAGETSQQASVHQGEQHSYDTAGICGVPGVANAAGFNTKWMAIGGAGAAGIVLCILVCSGSGGGEKKNISQSSP